MTILEGIGVFLMGIGATQVLAWLLEGGRGLWRRSQPVAPTTENTSTSGQVARDVILGLRRTGYPLAESGIRRVDVVLRVAGPLQDQSTEPNTTTRRGSATTTHVVGGGLARESC